MILLSKTVRSSIFVGEGRMKNLRDLAPFKMNSEYERWSCVGIVRGNTRSIDPSHGKLEVES